MFSQCFDIMMSEGSSNSTDAQDGEIDQFGNIGLALVKVSFWAGSSRG